MVVIMKLKLASLVLPFALSACAAPTTSTPEPSAKPATEVWVVASRYKDCQGVGPMKCMFVTKPNGAQELFYDRIEGFDYQEGNEYKIEVSSVKVANPPADASSIRYTLVKVISQTKTK
jgi:hypothetical protein